MVMRCSFALDPDLMEQIDQFAREHSLDRNEAILELIEAGLSCKDAGEAPVRQPRSFEDARQKGFRSRRNTPGSSGGSDLLTYNVCYAAEALARVVVAEDGLNLCHIDIWRATAEAAVSPRR